ncbi:retrovirus-related pol polyprotein from transposon TNT 1-94 [Tanacetum coccineum]
MLRKKPNKVYDPFLKAGLGYKNPECLKKAIVAQQKMYDGEMLYSAKLKIDSPDLEETLEDAEESRLKMRNKMVQINYGKLNALYETFVPQQEFSVEQTYFSIPSTSNNGSESKEKINGRSPKENILQNEIDRLFEVSLTSEIHDCVLISVEKQKNELLNDELEKSSSDSKDIQANLFKRIKILENDFKQSQAQSIDFELKLQHQKDKMACDVSWKSKLSTINEENVLLKTRVDYVVKERESIKLEYQKIFNSIKATRTQHQKELNELIEHVNQKTYAYADVRAHNQDLLITIFELKNKLQTVDKGKNVNTKNSSVKKALFTTPIAAKSKNLGATSVDAISRLSVAKTPTAKNKVSSKTAQSLPSDTKSSIRLRSTSNTSVTTQKWVAKLSTLPSAFVSCEAGDPVHPLNCLGHNLFSGRKFCDGDLEVAFRLNTCYVWNLEGDDLLTYIRGSRDSNLNTISISKMAASSPVCLMSRATSTKSWLWHRRLSHLNFGTINQLMSRDLVDGLSKFKYNKDHLCSACEQGKSKKASLPPKLVPSTESKLELLHMDFCVPIRVASINDKKYILVIVDDCSRNLKAQILTIRTDNGTEFKNKKLWSFYAKLGIIHKTSIARTLQQNGIVEQRNCTLVEAARTMLIFSKTPEFLWAKASATTCFTQNRSIVHTRYNKTPYELIRRRKPNVQYFHVFGSLCYPTNDRDDLKEMKLKADIGIFDGYSESSLGFRIYNRRTKKIMEMIHAKFHELTAMAFECNNSESGINSMNFQDSLEDSQSVPLKTDLDNLFGPVYEEYYATNSPKVSDNSAANTIDNENTSSSFSIVAEEDEAP